MEEIGTDINSSWEFNEHGDLRLVSDKENITQSIVNRLNCWLNSFDLFYNEYGSIITSFLGWRRNEETLGFLELELENSLSQDPRLSDYDLSLEYNDKGEVDLGIEVHFDEEDFELNLVINEEGFLNILEYEENIEEEDEG